MLATAVYYSTCLLRSVVAVRNLRNFVNYFQLHRAILVLAIKLRSMSFNAIMINITPALFMATMINITPALFIAIMINITTALFMVIMINITTSLFKGYNDQYYYIYCSLSSYNDQYYYI